MKKNLLLLSILAFVLFSCGGLDTSDSSSDSDNDSDEIVYTTDDAIEYNDEMIDIQSEVDQSLVDMLDVLDYGTAEDMWEAKEETLELIDESIEKVEEMDEFDGSDEFKDEMLELLDMYKDIVENELTIVIEYQIDFDNLSDDEFDEYYDLYTVALDKYESAFSNFTEFQEDFAEEWDLSLEY